MTELKDGDLFMIEVRKVGDGITPLGNALVVPTAGRLDDYAEPSLFIDAKALLPHPNPPIKVGDRVRATTNGRVAKVLAVDGGEAWVKWPDGTRGTWSLADITRVSS